MVTLHIYCHPNMGLYLYVMSASGQHSNVDDFLKYVHVITLFYVLTMGMPTLSNYDQ